MDGPHEHKPREQQVWSRDDWDRALAEGWLTRELVEQRLRRVAMRDFGQLGSLGYDEDGFVSALVADAVRVEGIGDFKVWPNDHDPPHVHVVPFGWADARGLRFSLETAELLDERPSGVSAKDVKNIKRTIVELHEHLGAWWAKGERDPVTLRGSAPADD